jgi:hypothetical protein
LKNEIPVSQEMHCVSTTKTNRLMRFRGIIAVYSENSRKHINTLYGKNAGVTMSIETGDT